MYRQTTDKTTHTLLGRATAEEKERCSFKQLEQKSSKSLFNILLHYSSYYSFVFMEKSPSQLDPTQSRLINRVLGLENFLFWCFWGTFYLAIDYLWINYWLNYWLYGLFGFKWIECLSLNFKLPFKFEFFKTVKILNFTRLLKFWILQNS